MRPITPDACTIELHVSEGPDAYLRAPISSTYWKASIKRLFGVPNQRIARMTGPKVLSPLPRRSQTANVGVPTHFSNHEAAASDRG